MEVRLDGRVSVAEKRLKVLDGEPAQGGVGPLPVSGVPAQSRDADSGVLSVTPSPHVVTTASAVPDDFGCRSKWQDMVLAECAVADFEACRYVQHCWRGEACSYRHAQPDAPLELRRLRQVQTARALSARRMDRDSNRSRDNSAWKIATGAPGGSEDVPTCEEDDELLLAKYEADRCTGCGLHPSMGCASDCPLLPDDL
jgi:hypothetical protein